MNYSIQGSLTQHQNAWKARISVTLPDGSTIFMESPGYFVERKFAERSMQAQIKILSADLERGDFESILNQPTRVS